uniref:Uncharacterized protein n=1 Tax=Setaria viridis TaxID=4556 RepID=A0A4U6SXM0_SETVI|nr:LOW QUALITY PROTEIN: hypothetical protein SEVIR_9G212900v2 [Setaria viridis]
MEEEVGGTEVQTEEGVQSTDGLNEENDEDGAEEGDAEDDVATREPNGEADEGEDIPELVEHVEREGEKANGAMDDDSSDDTSAWPTRASTVCHHGLAPACPGRSLPLAAALHAARTARPARRPPDALPRPCRTPCHPSPTSLPTPATITVRPLCSSPLEPGPTTPSTRSSIPPRHRPGITTAINAAGRRLPPPADYERAKARPSLATTSPSPPSSPPPASPPLRTAARSTIAASLSTVGVPSPVIIRPSSTDHGVPEEEDGEEFGHEPELED